MHLADLTHTSLKQLDAWFTNARSRIGWTSIVKRHFRGSKHMAIDSAAAVFSSVDGQKLSKFPKLMDIPEETVQAFLFMQSKARELYLRQKMKVDDSEVWKVVRQAEKEVLHTNSNNHTVLFSPSNSSRVLTNSMNSREIKWLGYNSSASSICTPLKTPPLSSRHTDYENININTIGSKRKRACKEEKPLKKSRNDLACRYVLLIGFNDLIFILTYS